MITEPGCDQDGPEADELSSGPGDEGLGERPGAHPGVESEISLLPGSCIDADGEDDETDDGDDLDAGEVHLDFSEPPDREEVDRGEYNPEDGYEDSDIQTIVPILNDDTGGGQFHGVGHGPTEPVDPAHRKTQRRIDEAGGVDGEGTGDWNVGGHFTKRYHDRVYDRAHEDESNQGTDRASGCKSCAAAQEQTCADGTTNGQELKVVARETTLQLCIGGLDILLGVIERGVRVVVLLVVGRLDLEGGCLLHLVETAAAFSEYGWRSIANDDVV